MAGESICQQDTNVDVLYPMSDLRIIGTTTDHLAIESAGSSTVPGSASEGGGLRSRLRGIGIGDAYNINLRATGGELRSSVKNCE